MLLDRQRHILQITWLKSPAGKSTLIKQLLRQPDLENKNQILTGLDPRFLFEILNAHFGDILIKVYEVQGNTAEKLFHCLLLELGFTQYFCLILKAHV